MTIAVLLIKSQDFKSLVPYESSLAQDPYCIKQIHVLKIPCEAVRK